MGGWEAREMGRQRSRRGRGDAGTRGRGDGEVRRQGRNAQLAISHSLFPIPLTFQSDG